MNLLQPQERRSKNPGDTPEAVAARRRLHERGVTEQLLQGILSFLKATSDDVVLDAGCGEGYYLGNLTRLTGCSGHGIDISIPAVDAAARKYPECEWIVGNADRLLPYADGSFSILMSITARMNAAEFRRVLKGDGRLLVGLAAPDDLIELRGCGRDRVERTVAEFSPRFELISMSRVSSSVELDAGGVKDVQLSIYRPRQREEAKNMRVTFSLDLLLFRPTLLT